MSLPPTVRELCPDFDFGNDKMIVLEYFHTAEFFDGVFEDPGSPQHMRGQAFLILWIRNERVPYANRCMFVHNGKRGDLPRYQSGWHGFVDCYRTQPGWLHPHMVGFNWAGADYEPRRVRLIRVGPLQGFYPIILYSGYLWIRSKPTWCLALRARHLETDPDFWLRMGRVPCMTDPGLSRL